MNEGLISQLFDFGALGLFAAFLIWLYVGTQKRTDTAQANFTSMIESMNEDYDTRVEGMRSRYGEVIAGLRVEANDQQKACLQELEMNRKDITAKIDIMSRQLERIESLHRDLETSKKIKEFARNLRVQRETDPQADVTGELMKLATSLNDEEDRG